MKKPLVMPFYFPNWHPTHFNEEWHGKGWTEWEVVKHAAVRFEGHYQPKVPAWGYENENDVSVMKKKIRYARENGCDGFIWDWYWYNEGAYRLDCLDDAFLPALEGEDFKFAIMLCNHDPIYVHPGSYMHVKNKTTSLFDGVLTPETLFKCTQHCIDKYFCHPNYLKLDGKLYFSVYRLDMLIKSFGGVEGVKKFIYDFRERAARAGHGELNINANHTMFNINPDPEEAARLIKYMGFDSIGYYGTGMYQTSDPWPIAKYDEICEIGYSKQNAMLSVARNAGLEYYANVATGWDSSPRTTPSDMYEDIGYPYYRIINDNTPEKFEKWLRIRKKFCDDNNIPLLTVFAWNEWTEGGYLEPDEKYGDGFIKAIKRVFNDN